MALSKKEIGADVFLYPMPVTLVGAQVSGRPNYLAVAFCGIMDAHPPIIYVALNKKHYTNAGIKENRTFSVNIPSADQAAATDYCGMVSGSKVDKSRLFKTFYGALGTAPMISECQVSMECSLVKVLDFGGLDETFIGEIVQTHADESCLTDGLPDMKKVRPMAFTMHDNNYWSLGEHLGKAWSIGNTLKLKD